MSRDIIFQLEGVTKVRSSATSTFVLEIEDLVIARGSKVALVGNSGCGKSTLLDMVAMTLRPDGGRILYHDPSEIDVTDLWRRDAAGRIARLRSSQIGYVLQTGGLLPFLDVRSNILVSPRLLGQPCHGVAEDLAKALGIGRHLRKRPSQLSVGERQRVAIARALAHSPSAVIADEPTASLDPVMAAEVMRMLSALVEARGTTLIMATHDPALARRFGFRLAGFSARPMRDGVCVTVSPLEEKP